MTDRDRLIELIKQATNSHLDYLESIDQKGLTDTEGRAKFIANHLLANGVIVTPCVAMVEQFIKDGKFDRKRTAHNGRIAVVYIDKSKWNAPLIDITEEFYNTGKANERVKVLKERER